MGRIDRGRATVVLLALGALVGCTAAPSSSVATSSSAAGGSPPTGSGVAAATATARPAMIAELAPGTYADIVTDDLVLRSEPGTSAESEIYPDRLNAPTSVYVAEGPVEADGFAWFLVVGFGDDGTEPALIGWAAAAGKDGEVWLEPIEHANDEWSLLDTGDAPAGLSPRSSAMGPDGQVYFFGSHALADEPDGHAWAYDPTDGAWRELAPMPTPRTRPMVAATEDGLFYVIGGSPGGSIFSEDTSIVEVYDAETNRWTGAAPAPVAPDFFGDGVAMADGAGRIRVFASDVVLVYDPGTSAWETEPGNRNTFWDAAMGSGSELYLLDYGGAVQPYDPAAGFGEATEVRAIWRYGAAMATGTDGRLLVIGGSVQPGLGATCTGFRGGAPGSISLVEALDPATGAWTTMAPVPMALEDPAAFETADGILVVGLSVDSGPTRGEMVAARLVLASPTADPELASTDQETAPSGCGS